MVTAIIAFWVAWILLNRSVTLARWEAPIKYGSWLLLFIVVVLVILGLRSVWRFVTALTLPGLLITALVFFVALSAFRWLTISGEPRTPSGGLRSVAKTGHVLAADAADFGETLAQLLRDLRLAYQGRRSLVDVPGVSVPPDAPPILANP